MDRLVRHAREIRVGNGLEKIDMGPLASQRELKRYLALLEPAIPAVPRCWRAAVALRI